MFRPLTSAHSARRGCKSQAAIVQCRVQSNLKQLNNRLHLIHGATIPSASTITDKLSVVKHLLAVAKAILEARMEFLYLSMPMYVKAQQIIYQAWIDPLPCIVETQVNTRTKFVRDKHALEWYVSQDFARPAEAEGLHSSSCMISKYTMPMPSAAKLHLHQLRFMGTIYRRSKSGGLKPYLNWDRYSVCGV